MKPFRHGALGLAMAGMLVFSMLVPNGAGFQDPYLARIMFTHVPCAMICSVLFLISAWHGVALLRSYNDSSAAKMHAAAELASIFAALTMVTGMMFSQVQWGAFWHNDPRQVSFLVVLFIYGGMIALRGAYADQIRHDRNTAWYAVGAILPALFFTFIYPRLKFVEQQSLHPTNTIVQNQLDIYYKIGLYGSLAVLAWLTAEFFRLRTQTELQARFIEDYGNNQIGGRDPARAGVVRPVALSPVDRD